jgi:cobaltochelatase CobN
MKRAPQRQDKFHEFPLKIRKYKRMKKTLKTILKIIGAVLAIILLFAGFKYYQANVKPTKIAFVNFPGYIFADYSKADESPFIKTINFDKNDPMDKLHKYDVIFVYGMGYNPTAEQKKNLKNIVEENIPIHVFMSTNPEVDFSTLSKKELECVEKYFKNPIAGNNANLLNYSRKELDTKTLFADDFEPAIEFPKNYYFHPTTENRFNKLSEYEEYYKKQGLYIENAPKILVLPSGLQPSNESARGPFYDLITELEKRGLNVYGATGFSQRLDFIRDVSPDMLVFIPHGRLVPGKAKELNDLLTTLNIPVISPQVMFDSHDSWLNDQMGLSGAMLGQNIIAPEFDGVVNSLVIGTQFPRKDGVMVFKGIPERIEQFSNLVENYLKLRTKANKDKKVAIVYYKGPGQNALASEGLEIVPSLLNVLRKLQKEGYTTGELPKNSKELYARIQKEGKLFGSYAKGSFDKFYREGRPAMIHADTLKTWMEKNLEPKLIADVENQYGQLPGEYMTTEVDSIPHLAVARVQFGNIVLMPQPMPATGDNAFKLIHGTKKAAPYPYVGAYLWAREGFEADAIMHFGTHGSLEFTPFKQTGLSPFDWSDALIGDVPHFYVYTIGNVGEGMIAKRRSYATLLSHLTPPFDASGFNSDLKKLHDIYHSTISVQKSPELRQQYKIKLKELVLQSGLDKQLNLSIDPEGDVNEDQLSKIAEYIHSIESEKITLGLYTLGKQFSDEQLSSTVKMMSIDPIAYSKAQLDVLKNKITETQKNDAVFFDTYYRSPAMKLIDGLIATRQNIRLEDHLDKSDLEFLSEWEKENTKGDFEQAMAVMISMSENQKDPSAGAYNEKRVKELMAKLLPDPENKKLIEKLQDPSHFEKSSMLLDRKSIRKIKSVAQMIPKMKEMLDTMMQPDVLELIELMQNDKNYKLVFEIMKDQEFLSSIREKEEKFKKQTIDKLTDPVNLSVLFATINPDDFKNEISSLNKNNLQEKDSILKLYLGNLDLAENIEADSQDEKVMVKILKSKASIEAIQKSQALLIQKIDQLNAKEKEYALAVRELKQAILNIKENYDNLKHSSERELAALTNALNGGFIEPSSAGDAVRNPDAVPSGKNFYSIKAENTPTEEAWKLGVNMADKLLATHLEKHGEYPQKVAYTLWGGEFIRGEGANLALIFNLLGVEPVRSSSGRVKDIKLVPAEQLKRPRIDVVVQTSGQFRDFASSRIFLINKAVKMAAEAEDGENYTNYVKEGVLQMEKDLKSNGFTPDEARKFSTARVFGGVNGNYGSAIMGMVEKGDAWETDEEIADQYIKNMGAIYTEDNWGEYKPGLFESGMKNTDMVVQPRSSNTWGPLSLDHVYEFMGGFTNAIRNTTGKDPDGYFADMRSHQNTFIQSVDEAIWVESQSTLLNPKYIGAMMEGEASAAEAFAETTRDMFGWNVMKPDAIDEALWDRMHKVYIQDEYELGVKSFFERENPYAMQEVTAVMLETARKGYWNPSKEVIAEISQLHTELVKDHDAGCSGFVCDNAKLKDFISRNVSAEMREQYQDKISSVREIGGEPAKQNIELKKVEEAKNLKQLIADNKTISYMVLAIFFLLIAAFVYGRIRRQ